MTRDDILNAVLIARRQIERLTPQRLYAVHDRERTAVLIVAGRGSEECIRIIQEFGLENWTLANTVTKMIQATVDCEPQVLTAVGLPRSESHVPARAKRRLQATRPAFSTIAESARVLATKEPR